MTVVLLGGIKSLETHYRSEAKKKGVNLKIFNQPNSRFKKVIPAADGIVLFTGEVSHQQAIHAKQIEKNKNIPLARSHSSSLSSLDKALEYLITNNEGGE